MKFYGMLILLTALACLQNARAQGDTVWICRDTTQEDLYIKVYFSDTFPDNRGPFDMVDTGDAIDGYYVNFDYQFGNPHPGYAGFKMYWDNGIAQFYVSDYDSLILWHKGPLPGHKVKMVWAQGSAGCGTPINYELFGEFHSSANWKRESLPFPVKRNYGSAPDSDFVKKGLFELRMLIYDDSSVTTSQTSAKGDLKIDNMYFLKSPLAHVIQTQPQSQTIDEDGSVTFTVATADTAPTFQWKKDGASIIGATSATYTIASVKPGDAGSYTVVVTTSLGSVTSNAAVLTVNTKEKKGCGCGSGTGLALIPPIFFKAMAHRKRKKKNPKA